MKNRPFGEFLNIFLTKIILMDQKILPLRELLTQSKKINFGDLKIESFNCQQCFADKLTGTLVFK